MEKKAFCVGKWTIVILAIYTGLTGYQSYETQKAATAAETAANTASGQLAVMKQQIGIARIEQRSWVQVSGQAIEIRKALIGKAPMQYTFKMENVGRVAADHVHGISRVEIVPKDAEPAMSYQPFASLAFDAAPIFPSGGPHPFHPALLNPGLEPGELTPSQRKSLADETAYMAIYGIVYYDDIFGSWWTQFCIWTPLPVIRHTDSFSAGPCVSFNTEGGTFRQEEEKH
jgi:hypothetical protein